MANRNSWIHPTDPFLQGHQAQPQTDDERRAVHNFLIASRQAQTEQMNLHRANSHEDEALTRKKNWQTRKLELKLQGHFCQSLQKLIMEATEPQFRDWFEQYFRRGSVPT